MAGLEQDGAFLRAQALVVGGVEHGHRSARLDGALGRLPGTDGPAGARLVAMAPIATDADTHDQVGAFEAGDLALLGVGQAAHPAGHRVEDFVELQRGAELEPRTDQLPQLVVAFFKPFEQTRLAQRPGQELTHRHQEVEVTGEVVRLVVVDVDEAVDDALDDQRQGDVAPEAPLVEDPAVLGVEARIVRGGDDGDLLRLDRRLDVREVVDPQGVSHRVVVVAVAVVAHSTEKMIAFEREDVAVGGVERLDQTPGRRSQELRDVGGASGERAELDELVQNDVAPPDLVEQGGRCRAPARPRGRVPRRARGLRRSRAARSRTARGCRSLRLAPRAAPRVATGSPTSRATLGRSR